MSLKKKLLVLGTAAMAILAPFKSKSAEQTSASVRQEQLDAVLRTAMNANMDVSTIRNEAIKYMDFPAFFPVTKDGQFDSQKCQQWIKDFDLKENLPHIKKFAESVKSGTSPEKAFEEFSKNISAGDKVKEQKLMKVAPALNAIVKDTPHRSNTDFYIVSAILIAIAGMSIFHAEDLIPPVGLATFGIAFAITGFCTRTTDADRLKYLQDNIPKAYKTAYDSYVNQTISDEKNKIVVMDAKQAADMVKFAKQNSTPQRAARPDVSRDVK